MGPSFSILFLHIFGRSVEKDYAEEVAGSRLSEGFGHKLLALRPTRFRGLVRASLVRGPYDSAGKRRRHSHAASQLWRRQPHLGADSVSVFQAPRSDYARGGGHAFGSVYSDAFQTGPGKLCDRGSASRGSSDLLSGIRDDGPALLRSDAPPSLRTERCVLLSAVQRNPDAQSVYDGHASARQGNGRLRRRKLLLEFAARRLYPK